MLDLSDSYQFKPPKAAANPLRRAAQFSQCQYANDVAGKALNGCPCRSAMDCPFSKEVEELKHVK